MLKNGVFLAVQTAYHPLLMTDALTKTGLDKATMENRQYGHIYKCDLYDAESVSH